MKVRTFCIYVFLFTFCAFTFNTGAGGGAAPNLIFTSWKVGRSERAGPSNTPNPPAIWYTFATESETQCSLNVSVGYAKTQPANAYKLKRYEWKVDGAISLPGLSEEEMKAHTFTFTGTPTTSGAVNAVDTVFTYSGTGTLSEHWRPTGGKIEQRKYCPNYTKPEYQPKKTPINGRHLSISVKFIGYYGTDPNREEKVEIALPLSQDTADQIRQEHIDQGIFVPEHPEFEDEVALYNHGHYDKMMNGGLDTYRRGWLAKVNEMYRQCNESHNCTHNKLKDGKLTVVCKPPNCTVVGCTHGTIAPLTLANFSVESAYRNPHHNRYHVKVSSKHPHGLHQYGYALDIDTPDVDGDGKAEQVYNVQAKSADGDAMRKAAEAAGGDFCRSWESYNSITHADWREDYKRWWPPTNNSSLQLSLETSTVEPTPTPLPPLTTPTPSTSSYHACGVHATSVSGDHTWGTFACGDATHVGYLCQASSDHSTLITGYSGTFYECQPHTTGACGHTYLLSEAGSHATRASCTTTNSYGDTCRASAGYTCQYHWHDFPTPITGPCGHIYGVHAKSSHARQASCPETNANGDTCTVTGFYACQTHTHVYPAIVCGAASWTGCTASISSSTEHQTACSNCSQSYWTCSSSGVAWHATPLTCQRSGCNVSLTKCQNIGGGGCFSNGTEYSYHDLP